MLLLIVFIVLAALCIWGAFKLSYDHEELATISGLVGFFSALTAVIMLISLCDLKSEHKSNLADYNNLRTQLEQSEYSPELHEKTLEMNNKIDKNRIYNDNIWIGVWYDEELGKCEKIEWKSCQ